MSASGEEREMIEHVLRDCSWSQFFWDASPLRLVYEASDRVSFADWKTKIRQLEVNEFQELIATLLWSIRRWKLAPIGWWKMNTDAAVLTGIGTGIGVAIRDALGNIICCRYCFITSSFTADIA